MKSGSQIAQRKPTNAIISDKIPACRRTPGSTSIAYGIPKLTTVSKTVNVRSDSNSRSNLDKMNIERRTGSIPCTRITPICFSLKSMEASPKNPTADNSKNRNSAVISRRFFISLLLVPITSACPSTFPFKTASPQIMR